jgi:hypothetical protein
MNLARKALAYGVLTFLEITVVVFFVMSLAAIAIIGSFGARKRSRALENSNELYWIDSTSGHRVG